jgi:hypothetical protein
LYFTKQTESALHKAIIKNDEKHTPLDLGQVDKGIQIITIEDQENMWKHKQIHSFYYNSLHQEHIDTTESCKWLSKGEMFIESEDHVMAIQDRVLPTKNYRKYIMNDNTMTTNVISVKAEEKPQIVS